MCYYVSDADGTGGRLRDRPADFRVREVEAFDVDRHPIDADPGSYPHVVFRATLRGWDTNDFARVLTERLGISRERVSWAGTKDKRAVTTQLFSLRAPDGTPALPELEGADCERLGRAGRPVLFGDLAGNEFAVVVREPEAPENVPRVTADLRAFAGGDSGTDGGPDAVDGRGGDGDRSADGDPDRPVTVGVPNYFGHQRFGTRRAVTHEAGLAVVRGDWEAAVLAYVARPSDREPAATREAREYARETRDWAGALERFPSGLGYERAMCASLAESGGESEADFRVALETLPSNLQGLLVNAAQSYAFNLTLSRRAERGLPFARPAVGDVVCFAAAGAGDEGMAVPDPDRTQRATEDRLRAVERHCERGRAFVTAPLVGTETEFADGDPGEVERSVCADLDLAPGDFDLPGAFGSTGTRRAILVRTDLETARDPLTFRFALPKGSYATVLLREYLKADPEALA